MFDWVTYLISFIFIVPSTLFADRVCQFELKYLESFGDKESFSPRYANRNPTFFFFSIAFINFISIFFINGGITFLIHAFIQALICALGFFTVDQKKIKPKMFDYIALFVSVLNFILIFLIRYH